MTFINKIKLLFQIKKPLGEISTAIQETKKSHKWFHLAVLVIGTLSSTVLALKGVIPPQIQLVAATVLQCLYNIMRGADKADNSEIKGTLLTTEFWTSGLSEVQKAFVAVQTGGVNPEWMAAATALVGAALSFGQNLAARSPIQEPAKEEQKP